LIDFNRRFSASWAICINLTYDPNRTAYLALIKYLNGTFSYILSPQGLFYGSVIKSCQDHKFYSKGYRIGYAVFVRNISINAIFFNIELEPNEGGKYARAAGTYGMIIRKEKEKGYSFVKLPTGRLVILTDYCVVTLGKASHPEHKREITGKAGSNRHKGIRPTVRGVAMNPVDHPHGGRTKTNSPEVTP
jgi:large subunit ribosomal protein L2